MRKHKFVFECGWDKGNKFKLLQVSILNNSFGHYWVIFGIQVAKFYIALYLLEVVA